MLITLEPKTRRGKNKLAAVCAKDPTWPGTWMLLETREHVHFAPGKRGPWHLIEPVCRNSVQDRFTRWVHGTDDDDFIVQPNGQVERQP